MECYLPQPNLPQLCFSRSISYKERSFPLIQQYFWRPGDPVLPRHWLLSCNSLSQLLLSSALKRQTGILPKSAILAPCIHRTIMGDKSLTSVNVFVLHLTIYCPPHSVHRLEISFDLLVFRDKRLNYQEGEQVLIAKDDNQGKHLFYFTLFCNFVLGPFKSMAQAANLSTPHLAILNIQFLELKIPEPYVSHLHYEQHWLPSGIILTSCKYC